MSVKTKKSQDISTFPILLRRKEIETRQIQNGILTELSVLKTIENTNESLFEYNNFINKDTDIPNWSIYTFLSSFPVRWDEKAQKLDCNEERFLYVPTLFWNTFDMKFSKKFKHFRWSAKIVLVDWKTSLKTWMCYYTHQQVFHYSS